ncbi:crotonase/enoyl-CoA hydratase family protein [Euzebya tangerina]|uniref:crotonase/enoyl-CoA hydratase family protein n=1 Tax=Euzebya tangerina TaxID=591198 RepID=UPI000E315D33|nr:crotonase/enoyl-CoA hydratase family protein [Euzebya tangerina]
MINTRTDGPITIVEIDRPESRNAVDGPTADALRRAFQIFDGDDRQLVAVLTGAGPHFCAGADLTAFVAEDGRELRIEAPPAPGPMGPTRMRLSKPVIAAVEGYAVAGGLELAVWADMRVAAESAVFGVFSRRFGVPLIDLGAVRLPRLVGHSHAMDMILTGRPVAAEEALMMGLANRVVPDGMALSSAIELARTIAAFPQQTMRSDRQVAIEQWDLDDERWNQREYMLGRNVLQSGEAQTGAVQFVAGAGRHGQFGQ